MYCNIELSQLEANKHYVDSDHLHLLYWVMLSMKEPQCALEHGCNALQAMARSNCLNRLIARAFNFKLQQA